MKDSLWANADLKNVTEDIRPKLMYDMQCCLYMIKSKDVYTFRASQAT